MADLLHPVGDGAGVGDIAIVGSDGLERFPGMAIISADDRHVRIVAEQGHGFDQRMQARGPIAFGDGVIRGRFARVAGDGGVELFVSVWGTDPRYVTNTDRLIAMTNNFQIWQEEWTEYALPLVGRQCDRLAEWMGDLWIRMTVVTAVDGTDVPTLGVASLWLEVPDAADGIAFQDPTFSPPPEDTLVDVRTFSGRSGVAKKVSGEWYDEGDQPFELDSTSLPLDPNGDPQASRAVNGWGT